MCLLMCLWLSRGGGCSKLAFGCAMCIEKRKYRVTEDGSTGSFKSMAAERMEHGCLRCICCWASVHHIVRVFTKRLTLLPLFVYNSDGSLLSFQAYNQKVKSEDSPPKFSGRWRSIDGSGNNARYPWLGQGFRGYGLHMAQTKGTTECKTTPEEVANDIAKRDTFKAAPNKVNALSCYFATIVIHDFFRSDTGRGKVGDTDRPWMNLHSSYLDMQPLYGYDETTSKGMRTFEGGKIHTDKIADNRLGRLRVCKCIVLLFAMEHNYICDEVTKRYPGQFTSDEELYQQARIINCGVWVGCIKREYIGAIGGVFPEGGRQGALLRGATSSRHTDAAGFHATLEFNIMYQFHNIRQVFDPSQLSNYEHDMEKDLHRALTEPAGAFGAFNVPEFLLPATAKAIKLCREMKLQTFNNFRRGVGLSPHKSFADLSKSPRVQEVLAKHYDSPDHIELAVGLMAEDSGPDGWGLSETLAFAILADALSSVSHDRFYTSDYTPEVYTPWGYTHADTVNTADLINRHTSIYVPRDAHLTQVQPPELWGQQHSVQRVPPQEMHMK